MSNRTGTNSYKCWAVLKLFAYWPEIEIMSSELGTQPVACRTTCSHCETRQHIANYRRYAHEFERHQFNKPSKFVRNKIRTRFLKTFETIAAAFAITCDIKRHLFNMRLCSSPTRKVCRDMPRHSLQLVARVRDNVVGVLVRCAQLRYFLTFTLLCIVILSSYKRDTGTNFSVKCIWINLPIT